MRKVIDIRFSLEPGDFENNTVTCHVYEIETICMHYETFTVARFNVPDGNGDIIVPGAVKTHGPVVLTMDFASMPIGQVEVFEEGEELKARGHILETWKDLTPAIGFKGLKSKHTFSGRCYEDIRLTEVSLCRYPNADPGVKSLREQEGAK